MKDFTLEQQKNILISYMEMKMFVEDWHGVADAAMDIRELEIKISMEEKNGKHNISK